ncbi:hypothetical protein [Microbacterium azadirachtae]|uniref:hypothetical protein n=1 Tax=Microbacterium azadirachtae TaxID=582680 RepID=UPI003F74F631
MSAVALPEEAAARRARVWFWWLGALAVLVFAVAWLWVAMAYGEEFSEEGKARAAGTTMAGTGFAIGLVPVLILHAVSIVFATLLAREGWGRPLLGRFVVAVFAVGAASLPGFVLWMLLSPGGTMFVPEPYVP